TEAEEALAGSGSLSGLWSAAGSEAAVGTPSPAPLDGSSGDPPYWEVPAAADCSAAVPAPVPAEAPTGASAFASPAAGAGADAAAPAGSAGSAGLSSGVGASYAGAVSPRCTASRVPISVGSPADTPSTASGRSSTNPASCRLISLKEHSGAPRVGSGRRP